MKLKKGSAEARAHMAKIRKLRAVKNPSQRAKKNKRARRDADGMRAGLAAAGIKMYPGEYRQAIARFARNPKTRNKLFGLFKVDKKGKKIGSAELFYSDESKARKCADHFARHYGRAFGVFPVSM